LVAGANSIDNATFSIGNNMLRDRAIFDYNTQSDFSIRVRSTDQDGIFVEKAFTIALIQAARFRHSKHWNGDSVTNPPMAENQCAFQQRR